MATTSHHHHHRSKFIIDSNDLDHISDNNSYEMSESDIWNKKNDENDHEKPITEASSRKLHLKANRQRKLTEKSRPINIPDWSMILRNKCNKYDDHGSTDHDDDGWLPPHEYLARTRIASFSVHEGVGRTLKGRDLSRVRNAIWKQTGFEED